MLWKATSGGWSSLLIRTIFIVIGMACAIFGAMIIYNSLLSNASISLDVAVAFAVLGASMTVFSVILLGRSEGKKKTVRVRNRAAADTFWALTDLETAAAAGRRRQPSKNTILRLISYLRPHWPHALAVATTDIVSTALNLAQPWIIGFLLVNQVLLQRNLSLLPWVLFLLILTFAGKELADYFQGYFSETLSQKIVHRLRYDVYNHLEQLPIRFFDNNRAGEVVSRLISDTDVVEGVLVSGITNIGTDLVTVVGTLAVLLLVVNTKLTLFVIPIIIGLALAVNIFKKRVKRSSRHIRESVGELAARASETIVGIRTVKSFSMEAFERDEFSNRSSGILRANVRLAKLSGLTSATANLIAASVIVIVIYIGAPWVVNGTYGLTIGALVAFLGYIDKLLNPTMDLSKVNISFQKAAAAGERLFEIIDARPEAKEKLGTRVLESTTAIGGRIEFDNVSFGYEPGSMILKDFNLAVDPGETVAIVGRSGVGKSTIVSLLLRFYEPASGKILIDGYPIDKWKLSSLRKMIGLVLQEPLLFSGSIRDNIAYGKLDALDDEIIDAAKASKAHDFIMALPDGYNTQIGERGVKLSSGQKQRVAIARTLIKNPAILILDEATSNVDSESEALIQDALKRVAKGRTTIVIGHRLSTIINANKIVVVEEGGVTGIGTHNELLQRSGIYARLYDAQIDPASRTEYGKEVATPSSA